MIKSFSIFLVIAEPVKALGFQGNPVQKEFKVHGNSYVNMVNKFKVDTGDF